jgi:hypothetical protein
MHQSDESARRQREEIDRLVAGDLDLGRRKAVVAWLEEDPVRWRACGLAFLEAQTWDRAMNLVKADADAMACQPVVSRSTRPGPRTAGRNRSWVAVTALAVAVLMAFAGGFWAVGRSREGATDESVADRPATPSGEEIPLSSQPVDLGGGEVPQAADAEAVGLLCLKISGPSGEREIRLPAIDERGLDEKWLEGSTSRLPDYVRSLWERQGFEINEEQRFVRFKLEDGRRVVVPLDRVQFSYVGRRSA